MFLFTVRTVILLTRNGRHIGRNTANSLWNYKICSSKVGWVWSSGSVRNLSAPWTFCPCCWFATDVGRPSSWKEQTRFPLMAISSFIKQLCKPKHNTDITVLSTNTVALWRDCKPRLISNKSKSVLFWRFPNKKFSFLNEWRSFRPF